MTPNPPPRDFDRDHFRNLCNDWHDSILNYDVVRQQTIVNKLELLISSAISAAVVKALDQVISKNCKLFGGVNEAESFIFYDGILLDDIESIRREYLEKRG